MRVYNVSYYHVCLMISQGDLANEADFFLEEDMHSFVLAIMATHMMGLGDE